ncbi:MAG: asparagine synthase (glutamine-hydrolyzing), partial [Cyclobacteriaceae bacterium]|nr:asparagine synthase (glutamine-hydrolyzing) [Cyclobacteriaceae bacterium]
KALDKLRGMFAFAIYDLQKRELFLARDHFGIKPLFYTTSGGGFAFASELKTLTLLPDFKKDINLQAMVGAVNFVWVPGNESVFTSLKKLPPAHYMTVDPAGKVEMTAYYTPAWQVNDLSENEALEQLDAILQDTMAHHMVADVPVSAFLSGGLDSSLISALAAKHNKNLSTYTIATRAEDKQVEKMPEDEKYARQVADQFGFDHHEILISSAIVDQLPAMVRTLDEPIGDPAAINTFLICQAARDQGVKVLLSGMGADELFLGYRRHKAILMAMRFRNLPDSAKKVIKMGVDQLPVMLLQQGFKLGRWSKRFMTFADLPAPDAYLRSYSYYSPEELNNMFTPDVSQEVETLISEHNHRFTSGYENDLINQMCNTDIAYFMNGLNQTYTDRASMAASVEVRVPFIDKEVAEFAMQLPGNLKFHNKKSKYLLKKAAEKYLPEEIIYRPKASFNAPIRSWLKGDLEEMVGDLLSEDTLKKRGMFNPAMVQQMIKDNKSGRHDFAYQLYELLTIELWMREYIDM